MSDILFSMGIGMTNPFGSVPVLNEPPREYDKNCQACHGSGQVGKPSAEGTIMLCNCFKRDLILPH